MRKGSPIQALYDLCKQTFGPTGNAASSQAIGKLCSLLDTIGPSDVGLKEDNSEDDRGHGFFGENLFRVNQSNRLARWAQPITYLHIYECDSFTIGIFCLPTSSVIPLHDHPSMTVLSKLLYGSMHVKAYDWIEPACMQRIGETEYFPVVQERLETVPKSMLLPNFSASNAQETVPFSKRFSYLHWGYIHGKCSIDVSLNVRLAKLQLDNVLTAPCPTTVLYPKSGGNLHCFTAVTPCAVLDVLAPPYSEVAGRRCTYYRDHPYYSFASGSMPEMSGREEEDHAWLEAIEAPDDLYMHSGKYNGPSVQPWRHGCQLKVWALWQYMKGCLFVPD